ncbi:AMP-binding protein (plasmid) [Streptomyces sp. CA-294286]|uniref:AMP-binding protein n=1 Tax=Streptomyces sp. CA-294286 TaxID=3240070 RepID=UPI003D8A7466
MTARTGDHPGTLHAWFAASAGRHPGRVALEADGQALTYRELDEYSARVAAGILRACPGPPRRVGLLAGRRPAAYAGYLAVQRLGATVVPLNTAWPEARNASVARLAGLDLVLTDGPEGSHGLPVPLLDLADAVGGSADGTASPGEMGGPGGPGEPGEPAYILFTSGSTGAPKGVPILQGNVAPYLAHVIDRYEVGPGSRLSQTFDLTFDVSVFDMFAAWGGGATLVVPSRDEILAPVRFVNERDLTHWCSVPSVISFARRLRALRHSAMPGLRHSLFAGEPLTLQQAQAWQAAAPSSRLENFYGPTELTITCSEFALDTDMGNWSATANGTVPIGHVYPHLEHRVLDAAGRPTEEGELCVRGPQRFPGYLDPADDVGRFWDLDGDCPAVPACAPRGPAVRPSDGIPARMWYRTGDRVRPVGRDGLLHLGRLDHQVKVDGYRVELGEIESALRDQPDVHDAVVLALPTTHGGTELHAVCTGDDPDPDPLLDALRERLPAYMVPSFLHVRPELPLNGNGKTDRAALAALLQDEPAETPAKEFR